MPQIDSLGNIAFGIGTNGVYYQRAGTSTPILARSNSGNPQFINEGKIAYQNCVSTPFIEGFDGTNYSVIDTKGFNFFAANDNSWMACLVINGIPTTRFSNPVIPNFIGYPRSIGNEGTYLLTNGENNIITVLNSTGNVIETIAESVCWAVHINRDIIFFLRTNGQLVEYYNGVKSILNVPQAAKSGASINNGFLTYQGQNGFAYAYNFAKSEIAMFGNSSAYNPTINDSLLAVSSINAGEDSISISQLSESDFSQVIINDTPVTNNQAYPRPMIFCPYDSFSDKYGATNDYIGNMAAPDVSFYDKLDMPLILDSSQYKDIYENKTYAYITSAPDIELSITDYNTCHNLPEKPIILYIDGRVYPVSLPSFVDTSRTFLGLQFYRGSSESLEDFISAMNNMLMIVNNYNIPLIITLRADDNNLGGLGIAEQNIETYPFIDQVIRDNSNVIGIMPFADMRGQGMNSYPQIKSEMQKFFDKIPSRPNRFDYWLSSSWKQNLKEKLDYTLLNLRKEEKDFIRGLY